MKAKNLSDREAATIVAALQNWKLMLDFIGGMTDLQRKHMQPVIDTATQSGKFLMLDKTEIETLINELSAD